MGEMVAAFVKGSEEEDWILAEVVQFNPTTNKYEGLDAIDEEKKDRQHRVEEKSGASPIDES
ncbi:hypothetical protein K0M31_000593 [Melipona bicolor]|uniref:SGF29 C-terminal domain-containing protein n=1 Tax=Melipona bicolor TaxID=60889 RepID=A0AA40KWT8_9HYME|nr:hypothetical protein K0M31_000593 [Melipona bicolor]